MFNELKQLGMAYYVQVFVFDPHDIPVKTIPLLSLFYR